MIDKTLSRLLEHIRRHRQFFRWWKFPRYAAHAKELPLATRVRCFVKGFFPDKIHLYPFDKHGWNLFVNDRQLLGTARINGQYNGLLDDKEMFGLIMRHFAKVPNTLAVVRNGRLMWRDGAAETDRRVVDLIRREKKVFVKPTDGVGGERARLLEYKDSEYWQNARIIDPESLERQVLESSSALISEYVQQGAYANRLFPGTVNTIRILTMLDPTSGTPFIAGAVQRVGRAESVPVDNFSSGGLVCSIDLDTGRLGKGKLTHLPAQWQDRHPDTGLVFEDQIIPNWDAIRSEVLGIAASLPMLSYVAWDIAVLDDGISIIEANGWSALSIFQMREPMLKDPRIREFYEHHGII
jgi:hypothetical protein